MRKVILGLAVMAMMSLAVGAYAKDDKTKKEAPKTEQKAAACCSMKAENKDGEAKACCAAKKEGEAKACSGKEVAKPCCATKSADKEKK
ncbi:MAG: hypothetical protein LBR84_00375 [Tannerella sp.]|jgi:hypothetical protein|nr:hypothetical protein [Tannerella sp.]